MKVVFRPEAEADLASLFQYLRREASAGVAGDYTRRLHAACMALNELPNRGGPRPELGLDVWRA